jgi:uncharacterized protein YjbI with pentapeptide repeats
MNLDDALKLLKGGEERIAEWNGRREADEGIPDLDQADLRGTNLRGANLNGANLGGANLGGADLRSAGLSSANLFEANLIKADLRGANLYGAILQEAILQEANLNNAILEKANLSWTNLFGANLRGTHLSGAELRVAFLSKADLGGAYLYRANLSEASLYGASLSGADLIEANLQETNLSGTNLSGANLRGANLSRAHCQNTIFAGVDLSQVKGLDSIRHEGPSTIGIDTLIQSSKKRKIPEIFLRGCGVPESLIQSLPLILNSMEPIQFYSCFISYSSKNQDFAERLHADLQARGVRTWFDRENLKIGAKTRPAINEAIRVHDKLMLVLTEDSLASDWVEGEVEAALERERREKRTVLFPIQLDDAVQNTPVAWASHIRQTRHIGDFRGWENHGPYQSAFARLLRDLKAEEPAGAGASTPPAIPPGRPG